MTQILVTLATGFVASYLFTALRNIGQTVRGAARNANLRRAF